MTEHRGITTYSSAEETLAAYERALADYEAVRERLTAGEQTPVCTRPRRASTTRRSPRIGGC